MNEKNLDVPEKLHGSSMLILGIMNRSIDLAGEILVKNDIPMPSSYNKCFSPLSKEGLLDKNITLEMERLIGKRGLFAHHYVEKS